MVCRLVAVLYDANRLLGRVVFLQNSDVAFAPLSLSLAAGRRRRVQRRQRRWMWALSESPGSLRRGLVQFCALLSSSSPSYRSPLSFYLRPVFFCTDSSITRSSHLQPSVNRTLHLSLPYAIKEQRNTHTSISRGRHVFFVLFCFVSLKGAFIRKGSLSHNDHEVSLFLLLA